MVGGAHQHSLCRILRRRRRISFRDQFSGWPDAISAPPQEAPKSPGGEGGAADSTSTEDDSAMRLKLPDKDYVDNCRRAIALGLRAAGAGEVPRTLVLPSSEREESPAKVNMLAAPATAPPAWQPDPACLLGSARPPACLISLCLKISIYLVPPIYSFLILFIMIHALYICFNVPFLCLTIDLWI